MKLGTALIASLFFCVVTVMAQAPANTQTRSAPHQPGVASAPNAAQSQPGPGSAAPPRLAEKSDPAKEAAIRQLMDLMEATKLGDQIAAFLTNQVRVGMSRALPPDQLTAFMNTFTQKFAVRAPSSAVTDAQVPIYASHLSLEDIKALIQFYQSPIGQRELKAMPLIGQESEKAGAEIDQKAIIDVLRGMSDAYPQLKQMLPPDPNNPAPAPSSPSGAPGSAPAPKPSPAPAPPAPQR